MKLTVSGKAHEWFQKELGVTQGSGVHFFGKYGGSTSVHTGFSVGMEIGLPHQPDGLVEMDGIKYFTEENDEWFFHGYDMTVAFDDALEEPKFEFTEH